MKKTILALCILATMTATAQKAKKGEVPNNAYIVTNAWMNPIDATNFLWSSDGHEITITNYNFKTRFVVIPDTIDGLPVVDFGKIFSPGEPSAGSEIDQVSGGANIKAVAQDAFAECYRLKSVSLPNASILGAGAFLNCHILTSVNLPSASELGLSAFQGCSVLTNLYLPAATIIGDYSLSPAMTNINLPSAIYIGASIAGANTTEIHIPSAQSINGLAFANAENLRAVYFGASQAPNDGAFIYFGIPSGQVTNFVTNPVSVGWTNMWSGMPVVRMPVSAQEVNAGRIISVTNTSTNYTAIDGITLGGTKRTTWPTMSDGTLTNNTPSVSFSNVTVNRITFENGMSIKAKLNNNGTNGIIIMQPGDANEYMIWLPPPPQ